MKHNNTYKSIHILYLFSLLGMLILCFSAGLTKSRNYVDMTIPSYTEISESFHLTPDGNENVDFTDLRQYVLPDSKTLILYFRLPKITNDTTLVYRSKDVYTSIYSGDELLYETSVPNSRFYNKSPGNLWNMVTFDSSYSKALLTLKIDMVYKDRAITADHFYYGNSANIIVSYVREKFPAIMISIIMLLMGLYMIIMDMLPRSRMIEVTHGLFYLGIYSLLIGVWSLLETNVVQFFVSDQRMIQLINNMVMIADTLPLFIYLDCEYKAFRNTIVRLICLADLVYIFVCIFAQFIGKHDLHDLLLGSQIALLLGNITLIVFITYTYFQNRKNIQEFSAIRFHIFGIAFLFFSALFEYLRFALTNKDTSDRAASLRFSILLFIIIFSVGSHIQTSKLMENGLKYKIVRNLAYSDGLTNLGNRTAFLEQLDAYSKSKLTALGIVFLDINNLKVINDQKGHEMGDCLIKAASDIILNSFGKFGKSFRIGGDEFCVLLENDHLQSGYESALQEFKQLIADANQDNPLGVEIHIAHGFSICTEMTREKIDEAINQADCKMYENKKMMKSMI